MALRIILTTGGTGGHIFPALAVAEALRRKHPDAEILFIGGLYGPEKELVEKAGIAFVGLPVRGFIGRGLKALSALAAMSTGIGLRVRVRGMAPALSLRPARAERHCGAGQPPARQNGAPHLPFLAPACPERQLPR